MPSFSTQSPGVANGAGATPAPPTFHDHNALSAAAPEILTQMGYRRAPAFGPETTWNAGAARAQAVAAVAPPVARMDAPPVLVLQPGWGVTLPPYFLGMMDPKRPRNVPVKMLWELRAELLPGSVDSVLVEMRQVPGYLDFLAEIMPADMLKFRWSLRCWETLQGKNDTRALLEEAAAAVHHLGLVPMPPGSPLRQVYDDLAAHGGAMAAIGVSSMNNNMNNSMSGMNGINISGISTMSHINRSNNGLNNSGSSTTSTTTNNNAINNSGGTPTTTAPSGVNNAVSSDSNSSSGSGGSSSNNNSNDGSSSSSPSAVTEVARPHSATHAAGSLLHAASLGVPPVAAGVLRDLHREGTLTGEPVNAWADTGGGGSSSATTTTATTTGNPANPGSNPNPAPTSNPGMAAAPPPGTASAPAPPPAPAPAQAPAPAPGASAVLPASAGIGGATSGAPAGGGGGGAGVLPVGHGQWVPPPVVPGGSAGAVNPNGNGAGNAGASMDPDANAAAGGKRKAGAAFSDGTSSGVDTDW
ncbi:unnamed protein product [Scytosiphon promiscuus]